MDDLIGVLLSAHMFLESAGRFSHGVLRYIAVASHASLYGLLRAGCQAGWDEHRRVAVSWVPEMFFP